MSVAVARQQSTPYALKTEDERRDTWIDAALKDERMPIWAFPLMTVGFPLLFVVITWRELWSFFPQSFWDHMGDVLVTSLPVADAQSLMVKDAGARLHYLDTHILTTVTSVIAFFAAVEILRRVVLERHGETTGSGMLLLYPFLCALVAVGYLAGRSYRASADLVAVPGWLIQHSGVGSFYFDILPKLTGSTGDLPFSLAAYILRRYTIFESAEETLGAVLVIIATACISARWQAKRKLWFRAEQLRHQMNWLLILFVAGSALLVEANTVTTAGADWLVSLLNQGTTAQAATDALSGTADAATKDLKSYVDALAAFAKQVPQFWGVLYSSVLVATFAPAFVSLSRDIEQSARIHLALKDATPKPPDPYALEICVAAGGVNPPVDLGTLPVAIRPPGAGPNPTGPQPTWEGLRKKQTYAALQAWKTENGLDLSFGQIGTALLAAAGPLLASPAIDATKGILH